MNETLKTILTKNANKDLGIVRRTGSMCVLNTKVGNVEIKYNNGQYMIVDFNKAYSAGGYAHYVGRKAGAVEFLVNNYEVINE